MQPAHLLLLLLLCPPFTAAASPTMGTLMCAGTSGFLVGTGIGIGVGYLVFGWRFRNTIGFWKGDQGFGLWGRRKRDVQEDGPDGQQ